MKKFDVIETWLNNVAHSHSGSPHTTNIYRYRLDCFVKFIDATAQQIIDDYENMDEKQFKRKYSMMLKAWISELGKEGYSHNSVIARTTAVKSFFKYNDLPLGFIPNARIRVTYHNRDITKEEIQKIVAISRPREKAFFTMMAQTGLRPATICKLKLKHIEPDFSEGKIPCKVEVPEELAKGKYGGHITFMGEESVNHLRNYFNTRPNMTDDNPLFSGYGDRLEIPCDRQVFTNTFRRKLETLRKKGEIDFEGERIHGKPAELRLYNLRKWFRKMAHQAGFELVQHWMGHVVKSGVDEHYRPKDVEWHRKLYAEKAMPFLRLETATPSETYEVISKQEKEIEGLKSQLAEQKEQLDRALTSFTMFKKFFDASVGREDFVASMEIILGWDESLRKKLEDLSKLDIESLSKLGRSVDDLKVLTKILKKADEIEE